METIEKISKQEFRKVLQRFIGTEQYHRHRIHNGMFLLLTDGCNYVRETGNAHWLFDLILSWQLKLRKHRFQVWKLQIQDDGSWYAECSDGNNNLIIGQDIPYSDLPMDSIEIWVIDGVALLPSEY